MNLSKRAQEILSTLLRLEAENRLHHAYIFAGPEGAGQKECAKQFAAHIFSQSAEGLLGRGSADTSQILERMERAGHPDFSWIAPEDGSFKVEQVREIPRFLAFAPLEAKKRIVVLESVQEMNAQTANAFLKTLEEPPAHSMFLLLCPDAALLLPTIRSRCQVLRFYPLSNAEVELRLQEELPEVEKKLLQEAAAWGAGSLARAKIYAENSEYREKVKAAQEALLLLWENTPRIPSRSLELVSAVEPGDGAELLLDTWFSLTRDFAFRLHSENAPVTNLPVGDRLNSLATQYRSWLQNKVTLESLSEDLAVKTQKIHRIRVAFDFHVSPKVALDALLGEMQLFSVGKMRQALLK